MEVAHGPLGDGESALVAELRLLHAILDRLPAMIAYWDRDLRNVVANDAYVEWFGISPEDMRGIHIREVLGEDVYAKNLPYLQGALAGVEQLFDRTLVDTSGRTRHTQASYVPDVVDGEVRGFFVLVTDVTPRVDAQRAMDEAQTLARLGSWSVDMATREISWTPELYRIFGVDPSEFVPTLDSWMALVHPDDRAQAQAVRDRTIADRAEYSSEYRIVLPDGTVREVSSRARPVLDASGALVRLTGTLQDVTEANRAARETARINEELVQVNQLNADVIGMLGHDVRAPLGVILGYLEEMDEVWVATSEEQLRRHLATVRRAALRLRTLVDDILALATLDAGVIVPRAEDHDLGPLVREALAEVPASAGIALHDIDGVLVRCDAFHVRQVLANLLSNAVRYGEPPVVVTATTEARTATVSVTDQGPGVPEDYLPRLFQRFAPGADPTHERSTGFGLYIAARLARANGGTLSYAPGPGGRGGCFSLTLPLGGRTSRRVGSGRTG